MYRQDTGMKNTGRKALIRRILAGVLLFVLLFSVLPKEAFAATDDSSGTNLSWKKLSSLRSLKNITSGVSSSSNKNWYILEVSTGTIRNDGYADNILYFNLYYTSAQGKQNVILMPNLDAVSEGNKEARTAGIDGSQIDTAVAIGGYTIPDQIHPALRSVTTDQILFSTSSAITSIDKLQIFGKHSGSEVTWSCQSLRIYRVDKLYGLDTYGWFSREEYIDFDGEVICDMPMSDTGGNFKWKTTGGTFNILKYGESGGLADCKLVNLSQKSSFNGKTTVGTKHSSQGSSLVVLRMDFADQGFAGFESLACLYESGSKPTVEELELVENAVVTVRYMDSWGDVREVALPFVTCAVGPVTELLPGVSIAGYAQQGDSIAIPLMLPDYRSIVNASLTIGTGAVNAQCGVSVAAVGDAAHAIQDSRIMTAAGDEIRYTCFAVYEDASKVEVALDGATLKYRFNENPVKATTGSSIDGFRIPVGTETYFYMGDYSDKIVLKPVDTKERYLVTLYTDNVINAGTKDDVLIQFTYTTLKGKEETSPEFSVRQYVNQFYGEWPGNISEFGYNYGFSQGGIVRFMLPINDVSIFKSVSYRVEGDDEWQVKGCQVQYVNSYESRVARFTEIKSKEMDPDQPKNPRYLSHLEYTRKVNAEPISFSAGAVTGDMAINPDYDPSEDPEADPNSEDWVPGDLVQEEDGWKTIDSEGKEVIIRDDVDWTELFNNMTFEDAQRDLGFTKERFLYTVHLKVAGDKVTSNDDDCGSANLFYFQLIFENGSSGVVLANQQIEGDAFRTGADVYFKIPTVMDYGEITAIVVIPDDQDSNSNIYDKMKIKYIEVMKDTNAAITPTWKFEGPEDEGLGWVGIEYRDPGESATIKGGEGHTIGEIATTYEVTSTTYSAKLLVSITTGAYQRTTGIDLDGNPKYTDCDQMIGGMSLSYSYEDSEGQVHTGVDAGDVVFMMDQYSGRTSSYQRAYTDIQTGSVSYAVSNPEYTFRGGKVDRFFLVVSDITKLIDMSFYVKSDRSTYWNIDYVSVHLVNGTGRRYINKSGEIAYRYNEGEKLSFITDWTDEDTREIMVPVYAGGSNGMQQVDISFHDAPIRTDKATNTWTPVINREPKSKNDTLNLFIYPSTGDKDSDPASYGLNASIIYTDAVTMEPMSAGVGTMDFSYDRSNRAVFSKYGISAANLESITSVSVKTNTSGTLKAPMSYGVLQRVRSGVLIETYYLSGVQNADKKSSMTITQKRKVDPGVQRVLLQVLSYNPPQDLIALDRDVALAVYFTPSGAPNQELRSKYIYLTDAGYTNIKPGQLLELDFDLGDVGEIRGINVVKTGSLDITFENALIVTQKTSGEIVDQYSIEKGFMPSSTPSRVNVTGEVELLKLDIRTALDTENTSSGTKDPVRMTIGYYDVNGAEQTETIGNIRPYIEADKALVSGQTDILKILISRLASVRYITFEPYDSDSATIASWTLASVSATVGLDGAPVSRQVNKTIVEETPETIFLTDMIVLSTIRVSTSSGEPTANEPEFYVKATPDSTAERRTEASIKSPEIGTLTVDSGALLGLSTRVSGSSKGFSVKFMQIDPVSGLEEAADLSEETYSYKDEELDEIYQLAIQSIGPEVTNEQEIEAAKTVIELINTMRSGKGSFTAPDDSDTGGSKSIIFQTPRNYSDQKLQYRIIVTAKENTTASYTLDIIVGKEEDQLGKAIEAWEKVRSVGSVSVLNTSGGVEETSDLKQSDQKSLLIDSGEGVKVVPRVAESEGFTAVVNSYDPATQAKGRADLLVRHSYSEDTLLRYESEANTILSAAESTDDERTEAQNVLNIISAMRAGAGSFTSGTSEILLNAPKNYTGSTVSYIVTVTNSSTNAELFSLIVTVNSETDTLQTAYSQMQTAKASGDQERVDAKAAGQQQNNADNTNTDSNTNNNSGDTTGGDANTGDTGNVEGGNTGEGEGGENAGN